MTSTSTTAPVAHPTRRGLLMAAPAIAALATAPALALTPVSADRSAWSAAMAAFNTAKAECDAFDPIMWRTLDQFEAGRPSMDGIHWREFFPAGDAVSRAHTARSMDLDKTWRHFVEGEGKWWWAKDQKARKARYRAALDSIQAFRDAEAKHERESGWAKVSDHAEELTERQVEASAALMAMPAPDLAALRWKLDYLSEGGREFQVYDESFTAQAFADIARLLPDGA